MNPNLLTPRPDLASLVLRLGLAAIFIPHGWIKLDVAMNSAAPLISGVSRTTQGAVGLAELACGLMMLVGLGTRVAAVVLAAVQVGAVLLVTGDKVPLEIKSNAQRAEYLSIGPEYNLVLGLMCLAVLVLGSGCYSLDHLIKTRWLARRANRSPEPVAP